MKKFCDYIISEKLRMYEINLFFDTIVYLHRCVTKIFYAIAMKYLFKISLSS